MTKWIQHAVFGDTHAVVAAVYRLVSPLDNRTACQRRGQGPAQRAELKAPRAGEFRSGGRVCGIDTDLTLVGARVVVEAAVGSHVPDGDQH